MIHTKNLKLSARIIQPFILFITFLLLLAFAQSVFAAGVFEERKKEQHKLTGADLNRIKAEFQLKFGQTNKTSQVSKSKNPWEKKKNKSKQAVKNASWGECRDYALHKRNRCYREGRDAYRCEQMYETRSRLCDNNLK